MLEHLLAALHVDLQDQIVALLQLLADDLLQRAVAVLMDVRPFVECILPDQLVEAFLGHKVVVHAVDFTLAGRAGRAGHGQTHIRVLLEQGLDDFGLARARGARNDKQHSTLCHMKSFPPLKSLVNLLDVLQLFAQLFDFGFHADHQLGDRHVL